MGECSTEVSKDNNVTVNCSSFRQYRKSEEGWM